MKPEIIEAGNEAGFELDLPIKLGLEVKRFKDVDPDIQIETVELYTWWWNSVLKEEYYLVKEKDRKDIWLPDNLSSPEDEEMYEKIYKKLKPSSQDKAIYREVYKQLKTSSERFPEGQIVLIKNIDGKWRPITLTRSELWEIPNEENYPWNWYMVSNCGMGYEQIPRMVNEKPHYSRDHKEVFNRKNLRLNEDYPFFLINHALTINPKGVCRIKGAPRAAIMERAAFAVRSGIENCETHSPLSGYGTWVEKYGPCSAEQYVEWNIRGPLERGEPSEVFDAVRMHANYGAEDDIDIFSNGREADNYRALKYTARCKYPIWKIRDRLEAKGIINFSDVWYLNREPSV